jgi:uncharacterized protein YgbK (DUF1537 family)
MELASIKLAFYGDDFTGSTDALERISLAGARAVLFTEPPAPDALAAYPGLDAFGVAGMTRAMPPEAMEAALLPAFRALQDSGARHVHYKVCSTFDSAPHIGSIGKAIDIGMAVFEPAFVPVIGGMPMLGRHCVFGNLFARLGTGGEGERFRLDRHPSMRYHPTTPMDESDLRRHLSKQTDLRIGLLDVLQQRADPSVWDSLISSEDRVVLFDALFPEDMVRIGAWLDEHAGHAPLFSVGSSGVGQALGDHWDQLGYWEKREIPRLKPQDGPLLVVSGSCSPVTAGQIRTAVKSGFEEYVIDRHRFLDDTLPDYALRQMNALLAKGKGLIVHTGHRAAETFDAAETGTALGRIAAALIESAGLVRLVVAGGDTSSYVARAMGIRAMEMCATVAPGAPMCKVLEAPAGIIGLRVCFKGGQVGDSTFFTEHFLDPVKRSRK